MNNFHYIKFLLNEYQWDIIDEYEFCRMLKLHTNQNNHMVKKSCGKFLENQKTKEDYVSKS